MTIEPQVTPGYVIIGPYGNIWSDEIFDTKEKAMQHVRDFWKDDPERIRTYSVAHGRRILSVDMKDEPREIEAVTPRGPPRRLRMRLTQDCVVMTRKIRPIKCDAAKVILSLPQKRCVEPT